MSKRTPDLRYKWFYLLPLMVLILVPGCESTSPELDEGLRLGEFEGLVGTSVNSGLYEELGGSASYALTSSGILEVVLQSRVISDTNKTEVLFQMETESIPEIGTFSFSNIDSISMVLSTGFSGFYLSPIVGLGEQYYTESGTLEITASSELELRGTFDAKIFSKQITGPDAYVRRYSTLKGEFYARKE